LPSASDAEGFFYPQLQAHALRYAKNNMLQKRIWILVGLAVAAVAATGYFYFRTLAPSYIAGGMRLTAEGDFAKADRSFRMASLAGDQSDVWFQEYGRLKIFMADQRGYDKGALRAASDFLAEGVTKYPNCGECWKLLSNAYLAIEEYENARVAAEKALRLGADDGMTRQTLALSLFYLGKPDEALAALKPATEKKYIAFDHSRTVESETFYLPPIPAIALNTYGWLLGQKGDLRGALTYFYRSLEIDPNFYAAACSAAVVRYRLNEFTAAELERLLSVAAKTDTKRECDFIHVGLGIAAAQSGDRRGAETHLNLYLSEYPEGRWVNDVRRILKSL